MFLSCEITNNTEVKLQNKKTSLFFFGIVEI